MEKEIIWKSGMSALITAIIIIGGGELTGTIDVIKDQLYGCEARAMVMPCERLSKYYGLTNGKCWNSEYGNKLCRSGWSQEFTFSDEVEEPTVCPKYSIAYVNNCATGEVDKFICNEAGRCLSTQEILSDLEN